MLFSDRQRCSSAASSGRAGRTSTSAVSGRWRMASVAMARRSTDREARTGSYETVQRMHAEGASGRGETLSTWRLIVSYRGERYAGWQRQENAVAVQQVLEEALAALLGEPVRTTGAGRTDAGVHARGQVVSLVADAAPGALVYGTNERLPEDVRVLAAAPAPPGFHARKHASAKEYRYRLSHAPVLSPLDAPFVQRVDPDL